MTTVAIAMEWVPQYRVPFYERLRKRLADDGTTLRLIHGDPPASRRQRADHQSLPWAEYVPNRFWTVAGRELTWQPVWRRLAEADLLVLQQETGLLLNYPMIARARLGGTPVALWGHGHNFNPLQATGAAERIKAAVTRLADWIFAYTERSAAVFRSLGVPVDRITVVQNSVDVHAIVDPTGPPSPDVAELVAGLVDRRARVGWIVSALDRWKRVPLLLDIVDRIRAARADFEFVAIGGGDDASILHRAAAERPWLHALGPRFGPDKAAVGDVAELTVHPGLIGLHVIESFATATPIVTADIPYHSHEVDYLSPGVDSIVLDGEVSAPVFATAVVELLGDDDRLRALQAGCRRAAGTYTLDAMVERFAGGVAAALAGSR